jgi:predicted phosphodiesterase
VSLAALYDIHGNLPALEAVLAELADDPPDAVVIGGDVAAGPMPLEVLAALDALPWPVHWLRGNADRALVMSFDGTVPAELRDHPLFIADAWTATRIDRAVRDRLESLPTLLTLDVDGLGDVLFCHATPRSDEERVTVFTPAGRLEEILAGADTPVVVAGHTHRQFDLATGGRRMINAGSVGRPYEQAPGAYWLRLGPGVAHMRTEYDTAAAAAAFGELGYPLTDMLAPVDADGVARRYEDIGSTAMSEASLVAR